MTQEVMTPPPPPLSPCGQAADRVISSCFLFHIHRVLPAGGCGSDDPTLGELDKSSPAGAATPTFHRPPKPPRPISKVTSIKKILNKKIKLNSHVRFDEEGEECQSATPSGDKRYEDLDDSDDASSNESESIVPIPMETYESLQRTGGVAAGGKMVGGGIHIGKAQQKIRDRDEIDRKLERERIRVLHRRKMQKKRKQDKAEDGSGGGTLARLAGDSDSDGGDTPEASDEEPLLGRKKRKAGGRLGERKRRRAKLSSGGEEEEEEDSTWQSSRKKPRKVKGSRHGKEAWGKVDEQLGVSTDPDLIDDERLAKHLLGL